jgi:hypothetical protein
VLNALALFLLIRASLEGEPAVSVKPHAETPVEFLRPEEVEAAREPVSLTAAAEPDEAETEDEKRESKSFFPA